MSEIWEEYAPNTSLYLQLSPSLLRRAADDMGVVDPGRAGLKPRYQVRDPQIEHIGWALDAERKAGYPERRPLHGEPGSGAGGSPARPLQRARHVAAGNVEAAAATRDRLHRGPPRSDPVTGPAGLRRRGQRVAPQDDVQARGLPVHEYVVQRRVERAKALLLRGDRRAGEVALEVGFAHRSHMARWMRRLLGVTPGAVAARLARG